MTYNITCKVCKISDVLKSEEAKEQFCNLVEMQWLEVDHRRKSDGLNIDFDKYLKMEELGVHYIVLAYTDEAIVGYCSMFCSESPHTKDLTSLTDSMYILKEYRSLGLGTSMLAKAEEEALLRGCRHMMVTFKNSQPHPNIVEELGFFSYETVYSKKLEV